MGDVFVYKIYSTFRNPRKEGFFMEDEKSGDFCVTDDIDFFVRVFRNYRNRLDYSGDRREFCTYSDGDFGRPLIPLNLYLLRRFNKKEIEDLEREIDKVYYLSGLPVN